MRLLAPGGPGSPGGPGGPDATAGSGYLIASGLVLTAAHVVAGAGSPRLVIDGSAGQRHELTADRDAAICDERADVALLAVEPVLGAIAPASWGALDRRSADLAVTALGFPQFSLTTDGDRRLHAATGTARPSADLRRGALRFIVDAPGGDPGVHDGSWGGMSGAVVWGDGRILGVITAHFSHAGGPVLTAALLSGARAELRAALPS